jgi:hypothetical protein
MAAMDRETFTELIRAFKHRAPFRALHGGDGQWEPL